MAIVPTVQRAEKGQFCISNDDVLTTHSDDLPSPTTFLEEFQVWEQN